ncbi:MAG: hypothetical protein EOM87_01210 [Clostridia bacterium]|nr:hypothetical protein [Clostridia bacterium]
MKKVIVFILLAIFISIILTSCNKPPVDTTERFTIAAGRAAFVEASNAVMFTTATKLIAPENAYIAVPYEDIGIMVIKAESGEEDEDNNPVMLFGIADIEGAILVACDYISISVSGNFCMATRDEGENYSYDFYYKDGNLLFSTENVIDNFAAIDDEYFVLYTTNNSEVFNNKGKAMFGLARQLTSAYSYSVCGNYLFAQEPTKALYFIYEIVDESILLSKSYISTANSIYSIGYIGNGDFLVSATSIGTASSYDYSDTIDNTKHYFMQTVKIYNAVTNSEKIIMLEKLLIGIVNKYTPTIPFHSRKTLNLKEGYSAVCVLDINDNKERIGQRYYVMNKDCVLTVKMVEGMTPFMFTYKNELGFAGIAVSNYSAALFSLSGDVIWRKDDAEYYAQSFNSNLYVLAKTVGDGLRYGLLDESGNTLIDFNLQFLATFVDGKSVAKYNGAYYRVDYSGALGETIEDIRDGNTQFAFNCYIFEDNGKLGVKNYAGNILIPADYDNIEYQGYVGEKTYIILKSLDTVDAYRLG